MNLWPLATLLAGSSPINLGAVMSTLGVPAFWILPLMLGSAIAQAATIPQARPR